MNCRLLTASVLLLGIACSGRAPDQGPDTAVVAGAQAVDSSRLIRPDGIAEARAGMTIGELRAALPAGTILGPPAPFMVDIVALPVVRGRDSLYYVLAVEGEPTGDDTAIAMVATDDTTFRTSLGVGPGMTVSDAAAIYGPATISYNTNDESREYAAFAGYQNPAVRFRVTGSLEGSMAGAYTTDGEFNTTATYDPYARIGLVMVILRP